MAHDASLEKGKDMKKLIEDGNIEFVRIELVDINGCSRGYLLDATYFLDNYISGFGGSQVSFSVTAPGEIIGGTGLLGEISYRNAGWFPDIDTFCLLPWLDKTASVICDARTTDGDVDSSGHPFTPRGICKMQVANLSTLGLQLYGAFEYEFYLLNAATKEPACNDVNWISTQNAAQFAPLANDFMRNMRCLGMKPEKFHAEYGPSQVELTFGPAFDLKCPDNAFRCKQLVKELAIKHGYVANFMTKPFLDFSGSSGHFNHSLWDENGKNVFYDGDMKYGISKLGRHWLAGLVHHSDTLLCIASPTPNCIERTNVGSFAPTTNAWGLDNRSLAYRVKNHSTKDIYFEMRIGSAGANPYLLEAACIIAGMDGMKRCMTLHGDPYEGEVSAAEKLPDHVTLLPRTLSASIDCLLNNDVFREAFGERFLKLYSVLKKHEDSAAEKHRCESDDLGYDLFKWYRDYYGVYL